jgi:hypothetical protein
MTTAKKEETDEQDEAARPGLQVKFEKFLAEGGAGRSNTNELLAAIVHELLLAGKPATEERRKPGAK